MNSKKTVGQYKLHAINAVSILTFRRVLIQLIQSLSNIVLARILFPQDFGIFALILMFINIFTLFGDVGLHAALIQKEKQPTKDALKTVFTVHIILGLIITVFLWVSAPVIARVYQAQIGISGVLYLRLAAVCIFLYNARLVSAALLERSLRYVRLVIPEIIEIAVQQFVAIGLALNGYGVASLLYGFVIGRFAALFLFLLLQPWAIGFAIKWKELQELKKFGFSYQVFQLLGVAGGIMAPVIVGNFLGTEALGLVIWALGVSALPLVVSEIIGRAVFMLGARVQHDKHVLGKTVERSLQMSYLLSLPMTILLMSLARPITFLVFTDKWHAGIDLIYLFSVQSIMLIGSTILNQALLAMGQARIVRNINLYKIMLHWILALILTVLYGVYGFALSYIVASLVFFPLHKIVRAKLTFHFVHYLGSFIVAATISGIVTYYLQLLYPAQTVLQLCSYIVFGFLLYFGTLALINFAILKNLFIYTKSMVISLRKV